MELLTSVLTGNIGTLVILLILWKSGLLKYLMNGNKKDFDGHSIPELYEIMSKLETHYNNDTTILLQDIREEIKEVSRKLERNYEIMMHIKSRLNGKD